MATPFFDYPEQSGSAQADDLIFLRAWDDAKWARLIRYAEFRRYKAGDMVIREGDTDRSLYVVIDGTFDVLFPRADTGAVRTAETCRAGAVLGEQTFLDGRPRSASLITVTDGEMLCLSVDAFEVFSAQEPELARDVLRDLARTLSARLRAANAMIRGMIR